MKRLDRLALPRGSRRSFAKVLALGMTGSAMSPERTLAGWSDGDDFDALVRLATEGCPVRLNGAELADLRKDIEEGCKGLSKIREFPIKVATEPALVFRAR